MRYFEQPFAISGDRAEIPTDAQPSGSVSLTQGYGPDYSKDPETDQTAKRIERLAFNGLLYDVTEALKLWQDQTFPAWVADKPGGYALRSPVVGPDGNTYVSLKAANADATTVAASWARFNLSAASTTTNGLLRLATPQEATAGTPGALAITPETLAAALAASTAIVPSTRRVLAGNGLTGGGALTGDVSVAMGTPGTLTGATNNATTETGHTHAVNLGVADIAGAAPLASPALTGNPTAPTQLATDNSTRLATTAWVREAIAGSGGSLGALAYLNSVNNANWSGTPLAVANGGTGQTTVAGIRTLLGLGALAYTSQASIAQGGTGANSAAAARTNLGLTTWATRADTADGRINALYLAAGNARIYGAGADGNSVVIASGDSYAEFNSGGQFVVPRVDATSGIVGFGTGGLTLSRNDGLFNFNAGIRVNSGDFTLVSGNMDMSPYRRIRLGGQVQGKITPSTAQPNDYAGVQVNDVWFVTE